jgi:flagellin
MSLTINTNVVSLNAQRNTSMSQNSLATSMQRLSSGLRVNSAKDDAAGLAIGERMNSQVRGMNVAIRNANDGISMAQAADGALGTVTEALQRMRELAVQAANGSNGTGDIANLDAEFQELDAEIDRIAQTTQFNGLFILDGDAGTMSFQVGANDGETLDITTNAVAGLGANVDDAGILATIDAALDVINTDRATYGASMNRFGYAISNLQIGSEAQAAARSRIMDADFASETANLSRAQILQQAGNAMIAQANQLPNQVLTLLRG